MKMEYRWTYPTHEEAQEKYWAIRRLGIPARIYLSYVGSGWVVTA